MLASQTPDCQADGQAFLPEKTPEAVQRDQAKTTRMAEEQGFEPWVELLPQRFSRPSRSTAPALLHWNFLNQQAYPDAGKHLLLQWLAENAGKQSVI